MSHDYDAFKRCGDDAGVVASISPDVRLAPIDRSNDFPCLSAVVERYKIILPDCGFLKGLHREGRGGNLLSRRRPTVD